jgi:hypothetical protein
VRRALVTLLIVLVVLGLGGVVADNYVRGRTEDRVAQAAREALGLSQKPEVRLGGFPFSMSFLTRSVADASLSAARVPLTTAGRQVVVTDVIASADAISLVGSSARFERVSITGVLDYGSFADLSGAPMSYAGDGRVKISANARAGGLQFTAEVTAVPTIDVEAGAIRFTKVRLVEGTAPPAALTASQLDRLVKPITVALPKGVRLTALTPSQGGVAVAAVATNLTVTLS